MRFFCIAVAILCGVPAKGGKVAFRGFRGRYRLSWAGPDGQVAAKIVEVR